MGGTEEGGGGAKKRKKPQNGLKSVLCRRESFGSVDVDPGYLENRRRKGGKLEALRAYMRNVKRAKLSRV